MRHEIAIGMNQKGLLCDRRGRRAHVHPSRQEALLMRLSVDSLRRVVKRDLAIEFVPQQLTSFGGLELLRRYVQRLELADRLRRARAALGGDYSGASLGLLILALLYAGARRLEHPSFQLDTFAAPKPRSRKRTYAYVKFWPSFHPSSRRPCRKASTRWGGGGLSLNELIGADEDGLRDRETERFRGPRDQSPAAQRSAAQEPG